MNTTPEQQEMVVLVDANDQDLGLMEKQEAHIKGVLHRAFSVFVFNDQGEMMLQQRAAGKYHSPLLWTNTTCSHPRKGETPIEAAHRRLMEEMGFDCKLLKAFDFTYKAEFENGLIEHEFDHVFIGKYNGEPQLNPEEAEGFRWISWTDLHMAIQKNPDEFTPWFKIALNEVEQKQEEILTSLATI